MNSNNLSLFVTARAVMQSCFVVISISRHLYVSDHVWTVMTVDSLIMSVASPKVARAFNAIKRRLVWSGRERQPKKWKYLSSRSAEELEIDIGLSCFPNADVMTDAGLSCASGRLRTR